MQFKNIKVAYARPLVSQEIKSSQSWQLQMNQGVSQFSVEPLLSSFRLQLVYPDL